MSDLILKYEELLKKYQGLEYNRLEILKGLNNKVNELNNKINEFQAKLKELEQKLNTIKEYTNLIRSLDNHLIIGALLGFSLMFLFGNFESIKLPISQILFNLSLVLIPPSISVIVFLHKNKNNSLKTQSVSLLDISELNYELKDCQKQIKTLINSRNKYLSEIDTIKENTTYLDAINYLEEIINYLNSSSLVNPDDLEQTYNNVANNYKDISALQKQASEVMVLRRKQNE